MLAQDIGAWTRQLCLADQARDGSSNGCDTACYTNQGGSPATPAKRSCGSHATGPGQGSSPPRSIACKRSHPQPADPRRQRRPPRRPTTNPRASACPQSTPTPPRSDGNTTATPDTPPDAQPTPRSPQPDTPKRPTAARPAAYCKRRDSGATARSRHVLAMMSLPEPNVGALLVDALLATLAPLLRRPTRRERACCEPGRTRSSLSGRFGSRL